VQYRMDNAPRNGLGAFMPGLVLNGVSFGAGLRTIAGFPGTREVEIEPTHAVSPLGWDKKTQPSNVVPDVILPTVYVPGTSNMGPFAERSAARVFGVGDNPLPVPAIDEGRIPNVQMNAGRIGGRKVVGWPQVSTVWPSYTGASG
jgi:hypothetical protein